LALGQSRENRQTNNSWQRYINIFLPGNDHIDTGYTLQKKALSELPNRSKIKNSLGYPSTQDDQLANKWKPALIFSIGELEKVLNTTFEREEVTTLR